MQTEQLLSRLERYDRHRTFDSNEEGEPSLLAKNDAILET